MEHGCAPYGVLRGARNTRFFLEVGHGVLQPHAEWRRPVRSVCGARAIFMDSPLEFFCGGAEMRKNFTGCPMGSFVTVPSGVAPTETLDVLGPNFLPTVVIFGV